MSNAVTIFVELPDEDERWEFVPGEKVICEFVPMEGGTKLFVAKRRA